MKDKERFLLSCPGPFWGWAWIFFCYRWMGKLSWKNWSRSIHWGRRTSRKFQWLFGTSFLGFLSRADSGEDRSQILSIYLIFLPFFFRMTSWGMTIFPQVLVTCLFPAYDIFTFPYFFGFTVRGMMYYRRALMLQSFLESRSLGGSFIWTFCIAVCDSDFHSNEVWHGYLLAISCVNSGQLFSKQLHYNSRFWIISRITGTGRFEVYLCCIMPNLWSTKAAKGTRSCWYCFIVAEVSICVLIIFKCIHDNILCMGTHIVYLKMCFQEASGHWTS